MAGEHFYDGFIRNYRKDQAKQTIEQLLARLNSGEKITAADVERELKAYVPG
jgi:thiaminase